MFTVTSIHAVDIDAERLNAVITDYLALEQARIYRQLFVRRFGALAIVLGIAALKLHWTPLVAVWLTIALCMALPCWAWIAELRCDRKLARALDELPTSTDLVAGSSDMARRCS